MRDGIGTLKDEIGTTLYTGFFQEDDVYMEGLIDLNTNRVEELLGEPGEVVIISPSLENIDLETLENGDLSLYSPVFSMNYPDLSLALRIEMPDPAAKQSLVTEVTSWSLPIITPLYTKMETLYLDEQNQSEMSITRFETVTGDGRDAIVYTMNNHAYMYVFNRGDGRLGELRINAAQTQEAP